MVRKLLGILREELLGDPDLNRGWLVQRKRLLLINAVVVF